MAERADWILTGGPVVTVNARNQVARAVAIRNDRILAVGSEAEVAASLGPGTRVTRLNERCVVPGFVENHAHLTPVAEAEDHVDLRYDDGCTSIAEIVRRVQAKAAVTPPGEWVIGDRYDHTRIAEKRHPTRSELNAATTRHPVSLGNLSGHAYALNDLGLQALGVHDGLTPAEGDWMPRDEQGRLTGVLGENCREKYIFPVLHQYDANKLAGQFQRSQRWWHAMGFTAANDAGTKYAAEVAGWNLVNRRGESTLRVNFMVRDDLVPKLQEFGALSGFGDDWVRIGTIKMGLDGAQLMRTCAMSQEWPDKPGYYGTLRITQEEADEFAMTGQRLGYNMTGHAIGDVAIDMILKALEKAMRAYPRSDVRHRIEHACFPRPEHIQKMKSLGISANTQCGFLEYTGKSLHDVLGSERMYYYLPYRSYIDAGIVVSGGSDCPCIYPDPIWHMHALTTRRVERGKGDAIAPHQAITVMEALKVYTWNGAYTRGDEKTLGSIEPGKYADLVVLNKDLSVIPPAELLATQVQATISSGRVVWGEV